MSNQRPAVIQPIPKKLSISNYLRNRETAGKYRPMTGKQILEMFPKIMDEPTAKRPVEVQEYMDDMMRSFGQAPPPQPAPGFQVFPEN